MKLKTKSKMKMNFPFRVLFSLLIITGIISCKGNGPDLTGQWQGRDITLTITKEGDNYFIKSVNPTGMVNGNFSGKYENGTIKIGQSFLGDITYSKDKDKLYFAGAELSRVR